MYRNIDLAESSTFPYSELGQRLAVQKPTEDVASAAAAEELPLTVKEAARYLGISPQTVYLWVERKQIPHLRVMGRSIRFLRSDLAAFRGQFKQEVENGKAEEA